MINRLTLLRKVFTDISTIGELSLNGEMLCDTLEDRCRNIKITGATAIPAGTYEVIINVSARFQRALPLLLKVPYFEGVRIHPGNTDKDTEGCILVGLKTETPNFISSSRDTFNRIFPKIEAALKREPLWIDVYGGYDSRDFEMAKKTVA